MDNGKSRDDIKTGESPALSMMLRSCVTSEGTVFLQEKSAHIFLYVWLVSYLFHYYQMYPPFVY
jgi:hypothetical protein